MASYLPQGDYDPATFVEGDFSTYPVPLDGSTRYWPGFAWTSTGVGDMFGQPVAVGDLLFALPTQRGFGDFDYGDVVYGGTDPNVGPWPVESVWFQRWDSSIEPPLQPPYPFAGCPFDEAFPDWRIVIDALYLDLTGSRVYGLDDYGDDLYGDEGNAVMRWNDITPASFSVTASVGTTEGGDEVPVTQVQIEFHDDGGDWFDFSAPARYYLPGVGTPVRVGFIDPDRVYHRLIDAQIERVEDVHDTPDRDVTITAYGHDIDASTAQLAWQRPAENASARITALLTAAPWSFGDGAPTYPSDDMPLIADAAADDVVIREALDTTCRSAGWFFDLDRNGQPRVRRWPHEPTNTPIIVSDCEDNPPGSLVSHAITYVADQSQILNEAEMANDATPRVTVLASDPFSISTNHRRNRSLGFPKTGLAFANQAMAQGIVQRAVNRFAFIVNHVEGIECDTEIDPAWLAALVDIDTGLALTVVRTHVSPFVLACIVVGYELRITRGRIEATLHTTTTTPTR